mmetsp:Transcript_21113/g.61385  ORF Transcript_21113/g.61385 Transcript_21113/m.61385 type:complete len:361 (-) Transcript_21113:410-1492(-)
MAVEEADGVRPSAPEPSASGARLRRLAGPGRVGRTRDADEDAPRAECRWPLPMAAVAAAAAAAMAMANSEGCCGNAGCSGCCCCACEGAVATSDADGGTGEVLPSAATCLDDPFLSGAARGDRSALGIGLGDRGPPSGNRCRGLTMPPMSPSTARSSALPPSTPSPPPSAPAPPVPAALSILSLFLFFLSALKALPLLTRSSITSAAVAEAPLIPPARQPVSGSVGPRCSNRDSRAASSSDISSSGRTTRDRPAENQESWSALSTLGPRPRPMLPGEDPGAPAPPAVAPSPPAAAALAFAAACTAAFSLCASLFSMSFSSFTARCSLSNTSLIEKGSLLIFSTISSVVLGTGRHTTRYLA